ncbi:MAG: hypothetical protein EKK46_08240 [Rhodocyclaceae bacterium]|nr:MAG: hypothetical protein EKK46_08240 [Rhodocyclaceae bacterium]
MLLWALLCHAAAASAEAVECHIRYGGEEKVLLAEPVSSPYAVPAVQVGSYFRLRVVNQSSPADLSSIKVYTYADRDDAPVLIHQASYAYATARLAGGPLGFTGMQRVYEPVRDGELEYWCRLLRRKDKDVSR